MPLITATAALGVLVFVLTGCGSRDEERKPHFEVRSGANGIEMVVGGEGGQYLAILGSRPWSGTEALTQSPPGLRLVDVGSPPGTRSDAVLISGEVPAGRTLVLPLAPERLATLPDPAGLQLMGVEIRPGAAPVFRFGDAYVIERRDGSPRVRAYDAWLWTRALRVLALCVLLPLAVLLGLARTRWSGRIVRRGAHWLVGAAVVVAIVLRGRHEPSLPLAQLGLTAPPLIWSSEAENEGDVLDRRLGPGLRQLAEGVERARQPEESVVIHFDHREGPQWSRAAHLQRLIPEARVTYGESAWPEAGLVIALGGEPEGEVLVRTPVGVLIRTGRPR